MVTCERCHKAKVKCSMDTPCTRCLRLHEECIPRESKRKRREISIDSKIEGRSKQAKANREPNGNGETGEVTISECEEINSNGSRHYGTNWVIRNWFATAFRRRSFSLLARAVTLANKCGITMDQILCGHSFPPNRTFSGKTEPMDFLKPFLTMDRDTAHMTPPAVSWEEIPYTLRQRMLTHIRKDESYIDCTWVLSITFAEGTCQYYLSKAMERDIASPHPHRSLCGGISSCSRQAVLPMVDFFEPASTHSGQRAAPEGHRSQQSQYEDFWSIS